MFSLRAHTHTHTHIHTHAHTHAYTHTHTHATLSPCSLPLSHSVCMQPLIRSITCWTTSRFSSWVVAQPDTAVFDRVVTSLLGAVQDRNKRVQQQACSALALLEEVAQLRLVPHLPAIAHTLARAYTSYQVWDEAQWWWWWWWYYSGPQPRRHRFNRRMLTNPPLFACLLARLFVCLFVCSPSRPLSLSLSLSLLVIKHRMCAAEEHADALRRNRYSRRRRWRRPHRPRAFPFRTG